MSNPAQNPLLPLSAAEAVIDDMIADAMTLVNMETYSFDKPRLDEGLEGLLGVVDKRLGGPDEQERFSGGEYGDIVVRTYRGSAPGRVVIAGHYDTVWPAGTVAAWNPPPHDDPRERLSGPGLFDMKIGLTQGIWALTLLRRAGLPHPDVTYIFNGDEEIGSPASQHIIENAARGADAAFVLEASVGDNVKVARKGIGDITVTATGIEAHAGLEPEKGASAIIALMEFCLEAAKLGDAEKGTTVNVGVITGGSGANVVAGTASAKIDVRHWVPEETERIDATLATITPTDPRVSISVNSSWNRPPMQHTAGTEALFQVLKTQASRLGHDDLKGIAVGGGSDANFISAIGVPVVCGLGAGGAGAHARYEYIYPDSVPFFTALLANAIAAINGPVV
ncbi:M20/M25/M40 family metallo-hydrolase [Corynebacterium sp. MSK041]|uniref:M20/M25/M40 family metallo-hydrolase n=1 Tax=Corynebacterium sp. MSK041 TaxID=3050194 RepID=UPI00254DEC6A|nr:M20/M25/M40 family metallo-hydrolase [Corynebacterium sp. MSK041]MDK8794184.1 M20/M25/M40 family metallo-hydrolase [Corynebacterium sp. MSK041]